GLLHAAPSGLRTASLVLNNIGTHGGGTGAPSGCCRPPRGGTRTLLADPDRPGVGEGASTATELLAPNQAAAATLAKKPHRPSSSTTPPTLTPWIPYPYGGFLSAWARSVGTRVGGRMAECSENRRKGE